MCSYVLKAEGVNFALTTPNNVFAVKIYKKLLVSKPIFQFYGVGQT